VYAVGDCAEIDSRSYFYIEPIRRQAQTVAAALCGRAQPFAHHPPAIRIKTPSLAITLCPPDLSVADLGGWHQNTQSENPCRMDFLHQNQLHGFALTGCCTPQTDTLYRQVLAFRAGALQQPHPVC
jgi:rubredoxin-NAD+ reductase